MTSKKLLMGAALLIGGLVAGTSASLAQGYGYNGAPNGYNPYAYSLQYGRGVYDSAPGYGSGLYDYAPGYGGNYRARGGPGPRVGNGSGTGIGSQR